MLCAHVCTCCCMLECVCVQVGDKLFLRFRRYAHDRTRRMGQDHLQHLLAQAKQGLTQPVVAAAAASAVAAAAATAATPAATPAATDASAHAAASACGVTTLPLPSTTAASALAAAAAAQAAKAAGLLNVAP